MSFPPNPTTATGEPSSTMRSTIEVGASITQVGEDLFSMVQPHADGHTAGLCPSKERLRPS